MSNTGEQPSPPGPEFQPESGASPQQGAPDHQPGTDPYAAQSPQFQGQPDGQQPYGGPPPNAQPPYDQPGDPQDPYAAAHQAGFAGSQEPPKPASKLNLKAMIPIVLAIALGGWVLWSNFGGGASTAEVGECLVLSGTNEDVSHEIVDCSETTTFSYLVGAIYDGEVTCDLHAVPYMVGTERRGNFTVEQTMCLVEHFQVDECYEFTPDDVRGFERVDCGSVVEGFRLTERIDETQAECTTGEFLWTYSEPPLTYCGEFAG